jgi:hypothetical protein
MVISHHTNGREKNSKDDFNRQLKITMKHMVPSVKMETTRTQIYVPKKQEKNRS